jgi:hypothetical protein
MVINYEGLVKRETYDEIVDYLENDQEKIRYPNRKAKQIRESFHLTNLLDVDGDGSMEIANQQTNAMKSQEVEHAVRREAGSSNQTASVIRSRNNRRPPQTFNIHSDSGYETAFSNSNEEATNTIDDHENARILRRNNIARMASEQAYHDNTSEEDIVMGTGESPLGSLGYSAMGSAANIGNAGLSAMGSAARDTNNVIRSAPGFYNRYSGNIRLAANVIGNQMRSDASRFLNRSRVHIPVESEQRINPQRHHPNLDQFNRNQAIEHAASMDAMAINNRRNIRSTTIRRSTESASSSSIPINPASSAISTNFNNSLARSSIFGARPRQGQKRQSETPAEEHRRRSANNERPDDVVDDMIRRGIR